MISKKWGEVLVLGVVSHLSCIASCVGAGVASLGCTPYSESGHPLSYPSVQLFGLVFSVGLAALYWKIQSLGVRLLIATILILGLWSAAFASIASLSLQTIFLFRVFIFLFQKLDFRSSASPVET